MSRPARARGLKQNKEAEKKEPVVAPRAGAWIETIAILVLLATLRRAPRGRVD